MTKPGADSPEVRLRTALDLAAAAEQMMRQNLKRRFPEASPGEIERRLLDWLRSRTATGSAKR